jgi:hypothetical protein
MVNDEPEGNRVTPRRRFLLVTLVGAAAAGLLVALLWMAGVEGRLAVALSLALTTPSMHLLDNRLAKRRTQPVIPLAQAVLSGVVAWIVLGWVAR